MKKSTNQSKNTTQKAVFCELPLSQLPAEKINEQEPIEMCKFICELWIQSKINRQAYCTYCISENDYKHFHFALSSDSYFRWSAVKKCYPNMNGDIRYMRGNKTQVIEYITKTGKHIDSTEKVIAEYKIGDLQENEQGKRSDLQRINEYIENGLTPKEIFDINIEYRVYEKIVKQAFFDRRKSLIPPLRNVNVEWHVGDSGTGKTYRYVELCEEFGENEVYLLSDLENGGLDDYGGEKILFIDEFRGQIKYSVLLQMLQGYKQQFHARYTDIYGLWDKVIITSVLPPEMVYKNMVSENKDVDTIKQLYRRINIIVYHYKENNEYKSFELLMSDYVDYADLKEKALHNNNFFSLTAAENEKIKKMFDEKK